MSFISSQPDAILSQIQKISIAYAEKAPGAREQLMNLSHALISSLELPSEAIQRIGWAEVRFPRFLRIYFVGLIPYGSLGLMC
jgi:hypothetical protein